MMCLTPPPTDPQPPTRSLPGLIQTVAHRSIDPPGLHVSPPADGLDVPAEPHVAHIVRLLEALVPAQRPAALRRLAAVERQEDGQITHAATPQHAGQAHHAGNSPSPLPPLAMLLLLLPMTVPSSHSLLVRLPGPDLVSAALCSLGLSTVLGLGSRLYRSRICVATHTTSVCYRAPRAEKLGLAPRMRRARSDGYSSYTLATLALLCSGRVYAPG